MPRPVPRPASVPEWLLFALLVALAVIVLYIGGGRVLWTRPLWTDEWCTVFVASQPSLSSVLAKLAAGGDWAPPLLHVVVWVAQAFAELTPTLLRSISLAAVVGALCFTFAALRRRFGAVASVAGALAVASHPLVLRQAFEIRPYALWLFAVAGCAWAVGVEDDRPVSRRRDTAIALFSILACITHWFGVLSLALIAAAVAIRLAAEHRPYARRVAPMVLGLLALAACAPLVLSQRASAEGLLWVAPFDLDQLKWMSRWYWLAPVPIAAAVILFRERLRIDRRWRPAGRAGAVPLDATLAALLAQLLMPVLLILLSVLLQPSMVDRYALVAALGWAPIVAFAVSSVSGGARGIVVSLLLLATGVYARDVVRAKHAEAVGLRGARSGYDAAARLNVPVVFQRLHLAYSVVAQDRGIPGPARFLDMPDATVDSLYPEERMAWLRRQVTVERNQARLHARVHRFPVIVTRAALDTAQRFVMFAADFQLRGGYRQAELWARVVFPNHRVTRIGEWVTLFELTGARPAGSQIQRPLDDEHGPAFGLTEGASQVLAEYSDSQAVDPDARQQENQERREAGRRRPP